jgi:hypothetical protein
MDITVAAGGEISVKVHYKERIPDLLSRFPKAVQQRAKRLFWWPSPYERKLWKATQDMPRWARETVRQHILHERAALIQAKLQRLEEKQKERALQQQAKITAHQAVVVSEPEQAPVVVKSAEQPAVKVAPASIPAPVAAPPLHPAMHAIGGARHLAGTAWSHPTKGALTLTEQFALEHGTPPAQPHPLLSRDRSR